MIYENAEELIGKTPLLRAARYARGRNAEFGLLAKLERANPAGSVKDRVALSVITQAEKSGRLKKGGAIIEPTSGNTGIGLAAIAAARGYRLIITMPDTMSKERRSLIKAYGAELVLTDGKKGMTGAIEKAEQIARQTPNSFIAGQFVNPDNPKAHFDSTGPEIWTDCNGEIDAFVCGVGTGGTLSGVGRYLKSKNENIKIIAVEPSGSPVLSGKKAGSHGLQGIGAGFVPKTLDTTLIDEIVTVGEKDAIAESRAFARAEGILVGISSGAALKAALTVGERKEFKGRNIVVLLPDSGERYLSSGLYED